MPSKVLFVKDVQAELEAVKTQKQENLSLYSFGGEEDADAE